VSDTAVSFLGFTALLATGLALEVAARHRPPVIPVATAGHALTTAMRTTPGRLTVLATWIWLGLHFLAR
jgi:hypothetical protein